MIDAPSPLAAPPVRANAALIAGLRGVPTSLKTAMLACLKIKDGGLEMHLPDGRAFVFGESEGVQTFLLVKDMRFARRVLRSGGIGFAEGYMAGEWETPDLSALLSFLCDNADRLSNVFRGSWAGGLLHWLLHLSRPNTRDGAKKNIHAHYDLGNRFYSAWLDPTMTYSSARFERPDEKLEDAQLNKYRAIARNMDLKPGEHVLEIGCGWGGFAEVAAREFGARVTGLTISTEQGAFARARMEKAGLSDRVEIRLEDYRDVKGPFDKIASIEMFEAVGERYWPAYFSKIAEVLKPGGKAAIQVITIRDDLFAAYRQRADFIQRYVFPGGMLPSMDRLKDEVARAGLVWDKAQGFGQSYAMTLAEWGKRFTGAWEDIRPLGFDEKFKRLWRFYLSYCEAGFRTARTDVVQIAIAKS